MEQALFRGRRERRLADGIAVRLEGVRKRFGDTVAVAGVDLEIKSGEFFSLLGPSGCGKTTLLRMIAGFDTPDEGRILIAGQDMRGVPPYRRPVNTVFQNYALFPHLTVEQNIAFGLRMKRMPKDQIAKRVGWALELVNMQGLETRRPHQLSGGQKQRVALARALVNEPEVLLLDEPLSALDLKLRQELRVELMNLQEQLGITFIFVTHDQEEALVMSDRIAVMNRGKVEQVGPAEEVYELPKTPFVAKFLGDSNLIPATALEPRRVRTPLGEFVLDEEDALTPGQEVLLSIRPEKIRLFRERPQLPNVFQAQVDDIIYTGSENQYLLKAGGMTLVVDTLNQDILEPGHDEFTYDEVVWVAMTPEKLVVVGTGQTEGEP
ncbi:spermidine/putrescine ABC transporter ATPase subunit [Allomeiothermus silvanus DSM 9946]|uniref:Spermidine/putrescine import ATP-binding protein PotA n=1 Tax=Allomeiothermus silvanus (strain ATCC 700542 / DSM 9946 / NBRC 106475 / NCIMB 13440 / VI-R2) TaxID=526227 RepID=D7BFA6_ALLS1|nr:polyamine ABC transporter ATP-binding protein [Allomeiothermus silvanus]ADH63459.1 spermidine/putrescine ABC transporter ATPase subunit [Allomeiothermus silvanus DSM 9946]